jgi:hypothetical protein
MLAVVHVQTIATALRMMPRCAKTYKHVCVVSNEIFVYFSPFALNMCPDKADPYDALLTGSIVFVFLRAAQCMHTLPAACRLLACSCRLEARQSKKVLARSMIWSSNTTRQSRNISMQRLDERCLSPCLVSNLAHPTWNSPRHGVL